MLGNLFRYLGISSQQQPAAFDENDRYIYSFDPSTISQKYRNKKVYITQIRKEIGAKVKKGEVIFILNIAPEGPYWQQMSYLNQIRYLDNNTRTSKELKSVIDGTIEFTSINPQNFPLKYLIHVPILLSEGDSLYKIHRHNSDSEKNYLLELSKDKEHEEDKPKRMALANKPEIIYDEFDDTKKIKWKYVSEGFRQEGTGLTTLDNDYSTSFLTHKHDNYELGRLKGIYTRSERGDCLIFSFYNTKGRDYIVFQFFRKELSLKKGDRIIFLFKNGNKCSFFISNTSTKVDPLLAPKLLEVLVPISKEDLQLFQEHKFIKWKIIKKESKKEILGGKVGSYYNEIPGTSFEAIIKNFVNDYLEVVKKEIQDYKPLSNSELKTAGSSASKNNEPCFVYLMINNANSRYKIGISKEPVYRERTLQSAEPDIETICSKMFSNRSMAYSIEKLLHEKFAHRSERGEWFNLDEEELKMVKELLT